MILFIFLIVAASVLCYRRDMKRHDFKSRNKHMRETLGDYVNPHYDCYLSDDYKAHYRGYVAEKD